MPSFQAKGWFRRRASLGRCDAGAEDGFLLVEVIVSALLVGMIVVATFTGFDVVGRTSTEQRRHNAAAVLAAESQEQLRSDNSTTLLALERSPHSYTRAVGGTTYTITQKALFGNGSSTTGCSATEEGSKGKGTYIAVSSSVTWVGMTGKAVTQSSIITPPTGSALTVEVNNGSAQTPTSGVTVAIVYTAVEASGTTTLEATTGSAGCVLFAGIPATSAKLQVRETSGIVNKQGTLTWPEEELTLAPNVLTNHQVVLAPGGAISATFAYEGSNKYKHKQNNPASAEIEEAVTGDTFVVYNANMKEPLPDFQTGSNQVLQNFPGGLFEVLPGSVGSYKGEATTQKEPTKYPRGNLFPFPSPKEWDVYAGDCEANDPEELTEALATKVKDPKVLVTPAANPSTAVPMTYVLLNVYNSTKNQAQIAAEGANAWKYLETGATSYPVTVTNVKCAGVTPKNETTLNNKHVQGTTTGTIWGGHLEAPFQPYGEYELCLFAGGKTYTPKKRYNNLESAKKNTVNIYLGEQSKAEKEAVRGAEELETKKAREKAEETARKKEEEKEAVTQANRETGEAPAREKREKEEQTQKKTKETEEATKAARLAKEKAEKEKWESEEKAKPQKVTKKEREAKEATQTTNRKNAEKAEEKTDEKRKAEEAATKATKATEEANKKKAEEKETGTKQARIANEATARKAAETKETETKNKAITKENEEIAAKEVTVESGRASC